MRRFQNDLVNLAFVGVDAYAFYDLVRFWWWGEPLSHFGFTATLLAMAAHVSFCVRRFIREVK